MLDALRKPPFEPLTTINLPNLTVKTVFLVALATGRRRSELHAMTMERSGLAYDGKSFMLNMDRNFLAKVRTTSQTRSKMLGDPVLAGDRDSRTISLPRQSFGDILQANV